MSYERDTARWANRAAADIRLGVKLVAFNIFKGVVERTPVDTGRARASWQIEAGLVPNTQVAPQERRSSGTPRRESATSVPVEGHVISKAQRVRPATAYVISNALPNIEDLEKGSSEQAPIGMVSVTVAEVKARLETNTL